MTTASSADLAAALDVHARRLASTHLRTLLADADRPARLAIEAGPLHVDLSRQKLDAAVLAMLADWARACGFEQRRQDLFAGRIVNPTENRPALHAALRGVGGDAGIASDVAAQQARTTALADRIRGGGLAGFRGTPVRALVCLGIGGSDLGPRLVVDALRDAEAFDVRFVANVDPDDLARELVGLEPATTAFAVVSKTFTTRETLANADAARGWLVAGGCPPDAVACQTIGVTAAPAAAIARGIRPELLLEFRDWVGGRYSLWSAVGLGIAVACGPAVLDALRAGAAEIDRHFRDAPVAANLPARLGLVSVWNRAFLGLPTQAIIPYAERLRLLPAWAQQLVMESNGKSAALAGGHAERATAPVVWGTSGTNAQHSFFQQLHQGPDVVPVDFVVARSSRTPPAFDGDDRHRILVANCLAQAAALALGREPADGDVHRAFPGDRPSTLITLPALDARALGALLAAYEHATFTAACVLGINPFDQFGVEYGKVMAAAVERLLAGGPTDGLDPATLAAAARLRG
ncbi:MAG: Glucose-6-phosphate isomerase [Pseudomonadota bacterium]